MRTLLSRLFLAALGAAVVSSCSGAVNPLEPGAQVTCSADADCPSGFFCSNALGRCVERSGADQTAPSIVTGGVTPDRARAGTQVKVTFEVSEDLAVAPVVSFSGSTEPLGDAGRVGRVYTVEFPAASALGAGTKQIVARLVDLAGNEAPAALVGSLTLDFAAPEASTPTFTPAFARSGTQVQAQITFTEPVVATTSLAIVGGPTLDASHTGNTWTFSRTLAGSEQEGLRSFVLQTADEAGNPLEATYTGVVSFDFTAPTVTASPIGTPAVRAGDTFVAGVTFSEPLGGSPTARLVPVGAGAAIPLQVSAIDASTYALSHDVPLGAADATYTLTLDGAADRAGNAAAAGPLSPSGAVRFDSSAPSVTALTPDHPNRLYRRGQPVVVTFTLSEAPAADPDVRLELLPTPLPLPCTHAGLAYTCTSAALSGSELPQSVVNVSVTVADPAGNVATSGTSVVLDFTNPAVLSATPGRAAFAAGNTLSYTVSVSEPLSAAPVLAVSRNGTAVAGFFGAPSAQSATTFTWSRAVPSGQDGSYTVTVAATDEAGNAASAVAGTGFSVDTAFPSAGALTVAPAKAAYRAGDRPTVSFTASESILAPTAKLNTTAGVAATCTPAGPATSFSCQLDRALAATDVPEGAAAFLVTLTDAAGNVGYASTALTLDYTPPALASAPATRYLGSAATRGVTVLAVGTGSSWELAILTAEPLSGPPVVSAGPGTTATRNLSLASSNAPINTSFVYTLPASATAYAAGTWNVRWNPSDLAGNTHATPQNIATVDVDGVAPAAPATGTAASPALTWTRSPWGTDLDPTPVFRLDASAASVGTDPTTLIAWDGAGGGAREVARGGASGGAFAVALSSDPADLWVSTLDRAGNESPRTRVVDVVWTAGLAGKVPGSTFENPHRLETRTYDTNALVQADAVEAAGGALGVRGDALLVTTVGRGAFQPASSANGPASRRDYGFAADPGRGVVVLYGGQLTAGSGYPGDTWEWNGTTWQQIIPVDPEGDGNPPTTHWIPMAYDPVRGGVLLASNNLWLWNGRSWKNLDLGQFPAPGLRQNSCMVWDQARGVLVHFGGGPYGNLTYEWNGSTWRDATPAAAGDKPSERGGHACAWDPDRQRVVMFGGLQSSNFALVNDTWAWDGTRWTLIPTAAGMAGRADHAMAFDEVRRELVIQGGQIAGPISDGQTFALRNVAGTWTWVNVTPVSGATPRSSHRAVYDTRLGKILAAGDFTTDRLMAWDGTARTWTVIAPGDPEGDGNPLHSNLSAGRADLVHVPARGRTVYHEGFLRQTWEWDRASWALRANGVGPSARSDATIGRYGSSVILFGGNISSSSVGDTWSFDGTTWTQLLAQTPATRTPINWYETYRQHAGMVNDAAGRLFRFGGADQYSGGIRCYSDVWEWRVPGDGRSPAVGSNQWMKRGGAPWSDPQNDGSPTGFESGLGGGADACYTRGLLAWDPVRNTMLFYDWIDLWEWIPHDAAVNPNSWIRHEMATQPGAVVPGFSEQGMFWDTTMGAAILLDDERAYAVDVANNRYVALDVANVYGATPPAAGLWAFDPALGRAVGVDQLVWTYEAGTASGPAHVLAVDTSRANGPDPAVCVDRAACPIQRIEVSWSGGASAPGKEGATLQVWNGGWYDAATTSSPAASPSLLTWTWTSASPFPASSLFHGASRELSLALVPNGATTAAGPGRVATDGVAVTIRYRRP